MTNPHQTSVPHCPGSCAEGRPDELTLLGLKGPALLRSKSAKLQAEKGHSSVRSRLQGPRNKHSLDIPLCSEVFFLSYFHCQFPPLCNFCILDFLVVLADRAEEDAGLCYNPVTQLRVSEVKVNYPRALGTTY